LLEGGDEADLLPVPFRQPLDSAAQLEPEALRVRAGAVQGVAGGEGAQKAQILGDGESGVEGDIAGEEANPPAHREARVDDVVPEDRAGATGRTDQAEQQPDRRGLPRPVRAKEAEDLADPDREGQILDTTAFAVVPRKRPKIDGGVRASLPHA